MNWDSMGNIIPLKHFVRQELWNLDVCALYKKTNLKTFFCICSIFAGLAILCNLLLMVTWSPSALVFYTKHCQGVCCGKSIVLEAENLVKSPNASCSEDKNSVKSKSSSSLACVQHLRRGCVILGKLPRNVFEKWLPTAVIRPRFVWTILLGSLIVVSVMVVFYYPKLKLPGNFKNFEN